MPGRWSAPALVPQNPAPPGARLGSKVFPPAARLRLLRPAFFARHRLDPLGGRKAGHPARRPLRRRTANTASLLQQEADQIETLIEAAWLAIDDFRSSKEWPSSTSPLPASPKPSKGCTNRARRGRTRGRVFGSGRSDFEEFVLPGSGSAEGRQSQLAPEGLGLRRPGCWNGSRRGICVGSIAPRCRISTRSIWRRLRQPSRRVEAYAAAPSARWRSSGRWAPTSSCVFDELVPTTDQPRGPVARDGAIDALGGALAGGVRCGRRPCDSAALFGIQQGALDAELRQQLRAGADRDRL